MVDKTKVKHKHLGRGLEALLGNTTPSEGKSPQPEMKNILGSGGTGRASIEEIPLDSISENPYQARTRWDEGRLRELAQSIEANGIVQPIVVRKMPTGYQLIAGERRFRASKMIGLKSLPAFIRKANEEQMLEWSLVENIHRADLNPVERARAYQSYISQFELSQTEAAKRLGEDRSVISNHIRLLDLPNNLLKMLQDEELSFGHLKAIMSLDNKVLMDKLANRALTGRLSVRELERLVKNYNERKDTKAENEKSKQSHIIELEGELTNCLGSRVRIETNKKGNKGRLVIEFNSLDEFDSVLEKLGIQTIGEI